MSFEYLEHEADVGIRVEAETLENLFSEAAQGLFTLMYNPKRVAAKERVTFSVSADSAEHLFVEFLNEIISLAGLNEMFFASCDIKTVDITEGRSHIRGVLGGEKIDREKHEPKTEVKAATYSGLKFIQQKGHYTAQCLLDI